MIRDDIVANALWGVANEPDIHYQQSRPIDGIMVPRKLPLTTDCSGFVTDCCAWAGAPDPNGLGYNGLGFTGTLLDHLPHTGLADAQDGDLIVYGPGPGDHVVVIVGDAGTADPWVVSHGQEKGPFKVRHSVEVNAHRAPVTVLQVIGDDTLASSDEILAKVNEATLYAADARNKADQALTIVQHLEKMLGSEINVVNQIADDVRPKTGS